MGKACWEPARAAPAESACVHTLKGRGCHWSRGKPKPFVVSDERWEGSGTLRYKTDWKVLGAVGKREKQPGAGAPRPWTVLSSPSPTSAQLSNLVGQNDPLGQPTRQGGFEVAKGGESLIVISPLCCQRDHRYPFERVRHFLDKITSLEHF